MKKLLFVIPLCLLTFSLMGCESHDTSVKAPEKTKPPKALDTESDDNKAEAPQLDP